MPYGGQEEQLGGGIVLYEKTPEGVAVVTLNKPDRMNGWAADFGEAWFDAYDKATADPDVRVIVVTGNGRGWCAGADMQGLTRDANASSNPGTASKAKPEVDEARKARQAKRRAEVAAGILGDAKGRPINYAMYVPKPIIAAIQGACAGGGLAQAMACDIRFAAEGVKFAAGFTRRGLIAEWGISLTLPRAVGTGNAMDILLSGRAFLAEEALRMGVVQNVFPREVFMHEVMEYATDMALNTPPNSVSIIKQQTNNHPRMDPDIALREDNRLMMMSLTKANPDFKEGVNAFNQKRLPNFSPLNFESPMQKLKEEIFETKLENERLKAALQAARQQQSPVPTSKL